jgi:hypothetical protein
LEDKIYMTKKEIKEALVKRIQERLDDREYSQSQRKANHKMAKRKTTYMSSAGK